MTRTRNFSFRVAHYQPFPFLLAVENWAANFHLLAREADVSTVSLLWCNIESAASIMTYIALVLSDSPLQSRQVVQLRVQPAVYIQN